MHAFEIEARAAAIAAEVLGGLRLHARVVEVLEAAARDAGRLERAPLLVDEPVVLVEAPLAHERVDLPAAGAAELLRLGLAHEAGRHREAAVRAAAAARRARRRAAARASPRGALRRSGVGGDVEARGVHEAERLLPGVDAEFPGAGLVERGRACGSVPACAGSSTSSPAG